jgi:transcriptional regulator with XRE-family HTH domain
VPPRIRARDQKVAAQFGKHLRAARLAAGLTQEALAERAELHPTYISNTERGYSCPTIYTVARLAKALKIDAGDLVRGLKP